ncbi:MAG: MerR family transcriptional regulator [Muribaculaceae bacterium]|nr:MerR family transcriptional regulator [Muribaculaceae bacterium]
MAKKDPLDKHYYRIREVAEMLDLPDSTLRFWQSQFPIIQAFRDNKGLRYYSPRDIENFRMIKYLIKDRGLKIEAARAEIKNNPKGIEKRFDAVERLCSVRDRLQNMLDALNSIRR